MQNCQVNAKKCEIQITFAMEGNFSNRTKIARRKHKEYLLGTDLSAIWSFDIFSLPFGLISFTFFIWLDVFLTFVWLPGQISGNTVEKKRTKKTREKQQGGGSGGLQPRKMRHRPTTQFSSATITYTERGGSLNDPWFSYKLRTNKR